MGLDTIKQPESSQEGQKNLDEKQKFNEKMKNHRDYMGKKVYEILKETELGNRPDLKEKTEKNIERIHKEALDKTW